MASIQEKILPLPIMDHVGARKTLLRNGDAGHAVEGRFLKYSLRHFVDGISGMSVQ